MILAILAMVFFLRYRYAEQNANEKEKEYTENVSEYENKIGELYKKNATYVTSIKNLKKENEELYNEVMNLRDNPIIVTKYETITEYTEIYIHDTVSITEDSIINTGINYRDDYITIMGRSRISLADMASETVFDTLSFTNNFDLDLIESDKKELSFIIKSDNPYCRINNFDGVVLSPEDSYVIRERFDKKWCAVAGIGLSATVIDGKFALCPAISITFGRKIFGF